MNKKLIISVLVLSTLFVSAQVAYAESFLDFFSWLSGFINSQEPAVSVYGNQVQANGPCSQQCGQDCDLEKCVNLDGCIWNKGNCDDICTPGMAKEVVVIKKYEGCSNAGNCNDVYLCENGAAGYPISVAFSMFSKSTAYINNNNDNAIDNSIPGDANNYLNNLDAVPSTDANPTYASSSNGAVSCPNLPASFVAGYNQYSTIIKNAADNYLRSGVDNPEALIAGIISQESAWDPRAVSQCASGGIAQFIPATARTYGLNVPVYDFVYCNFALCGKKVSECNACNPAACRSDDERFIPEKSIDAMARHVSDLMNRCGTLDGAIKAYNSGSCLSEANAGYLSRVKNYYLKWKSCLSGQASAGAAPTADSQYIGQSCTSPEGYEGTCQYATASRCTFYDSRCPGSGAVKCCIPDDNFIGDRCTSPGGAIGTCQYAGTAGCTSPYTGLCPGTAAVKCCFPAPTGYVTAFVTGMDTGDVSPDTTDLAYLDTMLNQEVLQEGQYTVSEKLTIYDNNGDFIYADDQGNRVNPECNIDPASSGVRDYWIGLQTGSDVCIGMHSVEPAEHTCGRVVSSEEIRNIFENIQPSTTVTVKDPYEAEGDSETGQTDAVGTI